MFAVVIKAHGSFPGSTILFPSFATAREALDSESITSVAMLSACSIRRATHDEIEQHGIAQAELAAYGEVDCAACGACGSCPEGY